MRAPISKQIDNVCMRMVIDRIREISLQEHYFDVSKVSHLGLTFSQGRARVSFMSGELSAACMFTVSGRGSLLLCFHCERPIRHFDFVQNTKYVIGCSLLYLLSILGVVLEC